MSYNGYTTVYNSRQLALKIKGIVCAFRPYFFLFLMFWGFMVLLLNTLDPKLQIFKLFIKKIKRMIRLFTNKKFKSQGRSCHRTVSDLLVKYFYIPVMAAFIHNITLRFTVCICHNTSIPSFLSSVDILKLIFSIQKILAVLAVTLRLF